MSDSRSAGWGFKSLCPHVFIFNFYKSKKERNLLKVKLNKLDDETKNKSLFKTIEYFDYNKQIFY